MKPSLSFLVLASLACLSCVGTSAEPDSRTPAAPGHESDINVRGVFTSDLPDVGRTHSLKLIWHPHIADLVKHDELRTELGLKYTLSRHLELRVTTTSYFAHGLGDTSFLEDAGFGAVEFGVKYRVPRSPWPEWDCAVGLRYSTPINSPPVDVTDGLEHRIGFVSFARPLPQHPDVRVFWGAGVDLVRETRVVGRIEDNDLREDNHNLSAGFVIGRGRLNYTLEGKWTTTRLLGSSKEDVFEVRPGIVWELGRAREGGRRSRWLVGTSLSAAYGPDGTELGLGARVRVDLDLKRLFKRGGRRDKAVSNGS